MSNKKVLRDEKGRLIAGSGALNPGGRPKTAGVSLYIMEKTNNLTDVVDIAIKALRNKGKTAQDRAERWKAIDYLTDRGIGKAIQQQIVELDTPEDNKIRIEFIKADKVDNENRI